MHTHTVRLVHVVPVLRFIIRLNRGQNLDDPDVLELWNLVFTQYNKSVRGEGGREGGCKIRERGWRCKGKNRYYRERGRWEL